MGENTAYQYRNMLAARGSGERALFPMRETGPRAGGTRNDWAGPRIDCGEGGWTMKEHRNAARIRQSGMGQTVIIGVLLAIGIFLLPGAVVEQLDAGGGENIFQPIHPSAAQTVGGRDQGRAVRLLRQDGRVEELTMEEYLWGVVAAEMPASFQPEALKAQAAAARTYTVGLQDAAKPKHPDGALCDDSNCCQAYIDRSAAEARWGANANSYGEKISRAVAETDGLGVLYQEKPIQAVFFSSAAGRTVDAVEVWGNSVAYLKGVDSPEGDEVPNYRSQVVRTSEEVRQAVLAKYPGADLSGPPSGWFSELEYNPAGGLIRGKVGGVALNGSQMRQLLGLRSASFTVAEQDGTFTFDVTGYGHGVGMSQYGANAMAEDGADFRKILTWYYTGTEIGPLWK